MRNSAMRMALGTFVAGLLAASMPMAVRSQTPVGKIVFQSNRDGNPEIYIMDEDGTDQTRLTFRGAKDAQATLSPDGTQIVFYSGAGGQLDIWVMGVDGSNLTNVTNHLAEDRAPTWHPLLPGVIIFQSTRDGEPEIYALNLSTGVVLRCTTGPGRHTRPTVRPAFGDKLLYNTNEGLENNEIWIADFTLDFNAGICDSANNHKIVTSKGNQWRAAWSPNGMQVLFAGNAGLNQAREVYRVDYDPITDTATNVVNITNHPAQDYAPDWSPDGTKVIFTTTRDADREIYVTNADGTNPVRLTNILEDDSQPHWGTVSTP